jgi:predicted nucleic acid-binding protein
VIFIDSNIPMYLVGAAHPHKADAQRLLESVVDEVFPITRADAERAKDIVLGKLTLSARDAVHAAVMEREGVGRIMTFESGFDGLPGLTRLSS